MHPVYHTSFFRSTPQAARYQPGGNEKDNAENKVGYTHRNLLVPVPTITDFDAFNAELLNRCDADHNREHYELETAISALWEKDKGSLLVLPKYVFNR